MPLYICGFLALLSEGFIVKAQQNEMLKDLAIPLMTGLVENNDESMLFDSPEGRIINAQASGVLAATKVYEYYRVVLPSLGWNVEKDTTCGVNVNYCIKATRDSESLLLDITSTVQKSIVTYALAPN